MQIDEVRGRVVNLQGGASGFEGVRINLIYELVSAGKPERSASVSVQVGRDGVFAANLQQPDDGAYTLSETGHISFVLQDKNGNPLPVSDARVRSTVLQPTKTTATGGDAKVSGKSGADTVVRLDKSISVGSLLADNLVFSPATFDNIENLVKSIPVSSLLAGNPVLITTTFDNIENLVNPTPRVLENVPRQLNKKLRGKVVDSNAKLKLRDNQIVFYGSPASTGRATVLGVCSTDGDGNFSLPYPAGKYKNAFATVSVKPGDKLDIALTASDEWPDFVWLVVQGLPTSMTQDEHDNCACSTKSVPQLPDMEDLVNNSQYSQDIGGSCINFTTPNRALEEFAYIQVIRTSDPELYNPASYKLEDRLAWVKLRVAEIQKQLALFASFPTLHLALVGQLQQLGEQEPRAQGRLGGGLLVDSTSSGTGTADPIGPAAPKGGATAQIGLDQQSEATDAYFRAGIYNRNSDALQRELQILRTEQDRLERLIASMGRVPLTGRNPIDWDDSDGILGTVQAATIAFGHILHMKQVWRAAGYSLGDLLYSLPLAPGQKKQIAVMEWDRRETAARTEQLDAVDTLDSTLVHDRDINEIVRANLAESQTASSHNTTAGTSGGLGVGFGSGSSSGASGSFGGMKFLGGVSKVLGVSGGFSKSKGDSWSDASQNSTRSLFSSSEQNLRDRTMQNASSVRSQRASVVTTVGQSESFRFTTEVVANHNHCHAITIQYFEVLRHFAVHHELADVQECLFVPFLIENFDRRKILRWRDVLSTYLFAPQASLRQLRAGFDSLQREEDALHGDALAYSAFPAERYCDEQLKEVAGDLSFRLHVVKPNVTLPSTATDYNTIYAQVLASLTLPLRGLGWWASGIGPVAARLAQQIFEKQSLNGVEEGFQAQLAYENFVADFCKTIKVHAVLQNNPSQKVDLHFDVTLISNNNWFRNDKASIKKAMLAGETNTGARVGDYNVSIALRPTSATYGVIAGLRRTDIIRIEITAADLPYGSTCLVLGGTVSYQTDHYAGRLFSSRSLQNDLAGDDSALISTPLTQDEMRNPRHEDKKSAQLLERHLESNREYYHKLLWSALDEQRLFNLLDRYTIQLPRLRYKTYVDQGQVKTGLELDGAGKPIMQYDTRSVASVVDFKRLGFAGNSVIFAVAKGLNVNRDFLLIPNFVPSPNDRTLGVLTDQVPVDLIDFYKPAPGTKHEPKPFRISVPTKGLFAEAVSGACNSCEKIDDSRFWKWEEHPIDEPTAIEPISTQTRRTDPGNLSPKDFATPIVNIQNAPAAPDPTGLSKALDLLGKSDAFRDITGLSETQKNAMAALTTSSAAATQYATTAQQLASKAGDISLEAMKTMSAYDLDRRSKALQGLSQLENSKLDADTKAALTKKAFEQLLGDSPELGQMTALLRQGEQARQEQAGKGKYDDALKVLDKAEGSQKVEIDTDGSVTVQQPVIDEDNSQNPPDLQQQLAWLKDIDLSGVGDDKRWAYMMAIMKALREGVIFRSKEDLLQSIMQ
ncbi:hypothetical protein KAK07_22930 [Ideonella sp. 4Y16]|uniref:hypothetical protein n=1 Tax=Ideonella alba TaxID=2824118 RepID=UPI001B390A4A|nr:hypothetical protein [Ideonella alba]MBQ0946213.1 hypothetical protein [Ideonella alba]